MYEQLKEVLLMLCILCLLLGLYIWVQERDEADATVVSEAQQS